MQIRINLLPQEHRRKEMTPLATLLPVLACLTVVAAAGAFFAWTHFGQLARLEQEHAQLEETYDEKKPRLQYVDGLRSEESDYQARAGTIQSIASSRVPWTRKLDELCQVVTDDDGGERYLVWLTEMKVVPPKKGGRAPRKGEKRPGETVNLTGYCFSDENPLKKFNFFHEAVKQSPFYLEDCASINNPAGQAVNMDDGLKPSRAWTLKLAVEMKRKEAVSVGSLVAEKAGSKKRSNKK